MAVEELRVGVSVSESADLHRLGLVDRHLRLALGEVARVVIRVGASLVYGGHLHPDGYTAFLASELDRYGRADRRLHLIVGWSEHRQMSLSELRQHKLDLGLKGRVTYLDASGETIPAETQRGEAPETVGDVPEALTALRRRLVHETEARVLIGGKEHEYQGEMPGVLEEALLAIQAGQPLYLVGGFGGAAASVAVIASGIPERWPPAGPEDPTADPQATAALEAIREAIGHSGWSVDSNGLDENENLQLATSHRPSEVAGLVALGLRRTFGV